MLIYVILSDNIVLVLVKTLMVLLIFYWFNLPSGISNRTSNKKKYYKIITLFVFKKNYSENDAAKYILSIRNLHNFLKRFDDFGEKQT